MRGALPAVNAEATNDGGTKNMGRLAHAPRGAAPARANAILSALSAADLRLLEPIDYLRLPARHTLFAGGQPLKHLYFPASAAAAFVQVDARGAMIEIAHVGAEGALGITALLGAERARQPALVQVGGDMYRVPVFSARRAFAASRTFQSLALRFAELLMRQLSQNVVCKLLHSVEQQFCGRLLLYTQPLGGALLEMTHEQFAEALGARRQGITEAARKLQQAGAIAYSRGRISVLDPAALERQACECYQVVRGAMANQPAT